MITRWALKSLITSKLFAGITKPLEETLGIFFLLCTDKSLSEALIFASSNQQYDDRLFIELQVHYMKIPSSNLGRTYCVQTSFLTFRAIFVHNMFSPCSSKRRASDKDLPVQEFRIMAAR